MENRLNAIYHAASFLFINNGYSRTKSKDIAQKIGISSGMLYNYFQSKQDIMRFLLKTTLNPSFIQKEFTFPIQPKEFAGLEKEVVDTLKTQNQNFASKLATQAEGYPFEQMLSDAFGIISRYGTGLLLIEKNPHDVGKPGPYYANYRKKFFEHMHSYLLLYINNGTVRKVEYPIFTTQLIIETLSWWGMHVMNDAYQIQKDISPSIAKKVCMDNLLHAYLL